ncbi:hypothetical protein LINPERPRIM_LOCUS20209 [Linum perenne]
MDQPTNSRSRSRNSRWMAFEQSTSTTSNNNSILITDGPSVAKRTAEWGLVGRRSFKAVTTRSGSEESPELGASSSSSSFPRVSHELKEALSTL